MPSTAACTLPSLAALLASAAFASGAARAQEAPPLAAASPPDFEPAPPAPQVTLEAFSWQALARGHLLRARLDPRSTLALRLRGGRIGLYLEVQLSSGPRND